jgi:hypothetical protein
MFAFFLGHTLCDWHTSNIGRPLVSRAAGNYIVTATDAGFVALLNESDGHLFWRSTLSGVNYLEMRENSPVTIALQKHYFVVIDNETGVLTQQIPHTVKSAYSASYANETVVVVGPKKMALYNITKEIWSKEIDHEAKAVVRFSDDGSCIHFAGNVYSPENGEIIEGIFEEKEEEEIDFRYQPTLLEYYKGGQFVWRIDEPFYGSELVGVLSFNYALFKNETGLIVLNMNKGEVEKFMPMAAKNVVIYNDFAYVKNEEGEFKLDAKELILGPVNNEVVRAKVFNRSVSIGKITSTIPKNSELKCAIQSPTEGSVFVVFQQKEELNALIISEEGSIITNSFIRDSEFGYCWQTKDSFHVSYLKSSGVSYVNSFSQNISAQRSWETDDLIIASSENYALFADGKLVMLPTNQLSATMDMPEGDSVSAGGALSMMKSMFSGEITAGPAFYEQHLHGVNAQHTIYGYTSIADSQTRVILKGVDVLLLGEQVKDRTMNIIIVCIFVLCASYLGVKHYTSKKASFWK